MKTDEILHSVGESVEYGRQYIEQQKQLIRLETAERLAKTTSSLVTAAVLAFLGLMVMVLLSVTLAFWLGSLWGSYSLSFLAVTVFYATLAILIFQFKKSLLTNPILSIVLKEMLD